MKTIVTSLILCFAFVSASAQDAVPVEILSRTLAIQVGNEGGTSFAIDYHGKLYLVTAKHVVKDLQDNGTIRVQRPDGWKDLKVIKVLLPLCGDADIAVLDTGENAAKPFEVAVVAGDEGPVMGRQVWFIGYPFRERLRSYFTNAEIPFIKRGTMSAVDNRNPNAVVIYIDGFNNSGFSGGPIVYWDFNKHAYRIVGVVQGYKEDTAKVLVNGEHVDTALLVNSGILVGYSIRSAIQAIEQEKCPSSK
jgi:S1-C subfamily serine protease